MKDRTLFLRRVKTVVTLCLISVIFSGIGVVYGRQTGNGHITAKQALAARDSESGLLTEAKKTTAEVQTADWGRLSENRPYGSLLQAAAYRIIGKSESVETEEDYYDVISTHALAQEAMETLEQETLQLMASPAGSSWGGMIKVYAGETPLLITDEDKEVLLRIVEAEATCEDVKGRMLVANVILNRVVSENFPDSITEVVFQNNGTTYQFSPVRDGRYWIVTISEATVEAVERVLAGEDESRGALYFAARSMADKTAMKWFDSSLKYLFRHGVHEFFTDK